jgi:hypothetical protein
MIGAEERKRREEKEEQRNLIMSPGRISRQPYLVS